MSGENNNLDKNDFKAQYKWSKLDANIVRFSKNYNYFIGLLILIFAFLSIIFYSLEVDLVLDIPDLGASLTIIGVIYPLVIGFVGVLFQKKLEKKAIFPIYKNYSGFMISGLSGLVLAIFLVLKKSIFHQYLINYKELSSAIDLSLTFWFILNLVLTIRFFVTTFDVINDRTKTKLLYQYSINESLIDGLKKIKIKQDNSGIDSFEGLFDIYCAFLEEVKEDYNEGRISEFTHSFRQIIDWYAAITDQAIYFDANGQVHITFLENVDGWTRTYHDEFLYEIFLFGLTVIRDAKYANRYFHGIFNAMFRLINMKKNISQDELQIFLNYQSYFNNELIESVTTHKEYEDMLKVMIGSWEEFFGLMARAKPNEALQQAQFLSVHLQKTCSMLVLSYKINNNIAVEWCMDVLLKWFNTVFNSQANNIQASYKWQSLLIQPSLFNGEMECIILEEKFESATAKYLAYKNLHMDLRILLSAYFLKVQSENYQNYVDDLLQGTGIKEQQGFRGYDSISVISASDFFDSYIRKTSTYNYEEYLSDNFFRVFQRIREDSGISGRIYVGRLSGISDIENEELKTLIYLSRTRWQFSHKCKNLIDNGGLTDERLELILKKLQDWLHQIKTENLFLALEEFELAQRMNNAFGSLNRIIEYIQLYKNQRILNAPIDQARLNDLGRYASSFLEEKEEIKPLLAFFNKVNFSSSLDEKYNYQYTLEIPRADIVQDIGVIRACNDQESITEVSMEVLRNLAYAYFYQYSEKFGCRYRFSNVKEMFRYICGMSHKKNMAVLHINMSHPIAKCLMNYDWLEENKEKFSLHQMQNGNYKIGKCVVDIQFFNDHVCYFTDQSVLDSVVFKQDKRYIINVTYEEEINSLTGQLVFTTAVKWNFNPNIKIEHLIISSNAIDDLDIVM